MRLKYFTIKITSLVLFFLAYPLLADGLLRSNDPSYPSAGGFLRHRMTRIEVKIYGHFVETKVYQEFVNEYFRSTDAVYAFPLPPDARAINFHYWRNDSCFKAVLRVKEQAVNPGTGEGGVAALVNEYIGRNGIKVALNGIAAGSIQKTQLTYINRCDYFQGKMSYEFPLNTQEFLHFPLDLLQVDLQLHTNYPCTAFDIPTHSDWQVIQQSADYLWIVLNRSKTYLNQDLRFEFTVPNTDTQVDFYSVANDSVPGHFVLTTQPDETADSSAVLNKRIIFLVDNSSRMFGYKLTQSKAAIERCLDELKPGDYFNIARFDYSFASWQNQLVGATPQNIHSAKNYLNSITTGSGSNMDAALIQCLQQFPDQNLSNAILAFASGYSMLDPLHIEQQNQHKVGIFMIGIGNDLERARLEMTALNNYGFVTYFDENDNLIDGISRVFQQINRPVLMDTRFEFGQSGAYEIFPAKIPSIYQGATLFLTGRYQQPGQSALSIAGLTTSGSQALDFRLDFSSSTTENKFTESFWAKEKIDELEREILVYGEDELIKAELIRLSLAYNIRCKYTAYIADYSPAATGVELAGNDVAVVPRSYILGNYPNPFNPTTTIRFYLAATDIRVGTKFIRIYNLLGQLVAVIDISHLTEGIHSVKFEAIDVQGNPLPSGIYLCQLVAGKIVSTVRMSLVR